MTVTVAVARIFAAAQKPCACDVDREAESGNRDGLSEMDWNRCKQPRHRFVPDEQSDHCENDGAGEPRETVSIIRDLLAGRFGVDAVALLSMVGAQALSQNLAAIVVAVMYAGGNALEEFAISRAERDLRSLIDRAPLHRGRAHVPRTRPDGSLR